MKKCKYCKQKVKCVWRKICIKCIHKRNKGNQQSKSPKKYYREYAREGRELTREKVRIRDNHTCQRCGKVWIPGSRRFDVHHIDCKKEKSHRYENYEKEQHNMLTLCHKCHLNLPQHRMTMEIKILKKLGRI